MKENSLISFTARGIYCRQADIYIDPWKPVSKAIVTHAHADHARPGNQWYLAHDDNRSILQLRLGDIKLETLPYGKTTKINGVTISLHPAGHIIGSAQVRLEYKGNICVITGDFKTGDDHISTPFEPLRSHTLVMESTFGLPVYRWKNQSQVFSDIQKWWQENRERGYVSVLCGYALGKAQRLIHNLDKSTGPVFVHGAVYNVNQALASRHLFKGIRRVDPGMDKNEFSGAMVITPSSALGTSWMRKFTPYRTAIASGWMAIRGARRRRSVDRGFVLSDHADWDGLNDAVKNSGAYKIFVTHGYAHEFSQWLKEKGYSSYPLETRFEGELAEINEQNSP